MATPKKENGKKKYLFTVLFVGAVIGIFHMWLHITNPYAGWSVVKQPYSTAVENGKITVQKNFALKSYDSGVAQLLGYYKSGFLIVQNTYFGSKQVPSSDPDKIIEAIHKLRFDPTKPYLISGDQFSVLYPRNLGVFYNSILDPTTAHSQQDWENRQRIYLQSVLYALDAFSQRNTLTTTVVPTGPQAVALTEVHPGSVPSDTLYGMLYALESLQQQKNVESPYKLQTIDAAQTIVRERKTDLQMLLGVYLQQVQDPHTKLIKKDVHLAAARDGVTRESSFYDNVVLWKTLKIASDLDIQPRPAGELEAMRRRILEQYWDDKEGHFKDDLRQHDANANYSSDWLIALPTGFLSPDRSEDLAYLQKSVQFIRDQNIAKPFPIKYQAALSAKDVPWAVKTFVPNYGGDAIWSYWGAQYITLLADLSRKTGEQSYLTEAKDAIGTYKTKMAQTHGYPETFNAEGDFLQNSVYKSIRQTGWVVQFETAEQKVKEL